MKGFISPIMAAAVMVAVAALAAAFLLRAASRSRRSVFAAAIIQTAATVGAAIVASGDYPAGWSVIAAGCILAASTLIPAALISYSAWERKLFSLGTSAGSSIVILSAAGQFAPGWSVITAAIIMAAAMIITAVRL